MNVEEEFKKPVPQVDKAKEDLNLLRAVAFLGFGLAALAIIFILFFIRDLDERVGGMDSAVKQVEESIGPLKTEVEGNMKTVQAIEENLKAVGATVSNLQGKFGDYEKSMAIMELKRALAMVQGISMGSDVGVKSRTSEVTASIQSLLSELGAGDGTSKQPAGEIRVQEAAEEPAAEESAEEPAEEESAGEETEESEEAEEEPAGEETEESEEAEEESADEESEEAGEESADEESEEAEEEPAEEESAGEESEEAEEESAGEESEEAAEEPAGESDAAAEESHEEEAASGDMEELPTVEELLKE